MKKINVISIFLLSCLVINIHTKSEISHIDESSITKSKNLFLQQSVLYIKKHAPLIALTPMIIYYHRDIIQCMKHQPCISSIFFYLLLNCLCDSISDYQQQQSLLEIIALLKKTTLYLVISHGIKNHIHQKKLLPEITLNDQVFLNTITENLPYSFDEITFITLKSYQELKSSLKSLNIALNIESEEFVFLCHSSSINIQSLLYLVQSDPILCQSINKFDENPQTHLSPLLEYLKLEITHTFITLEQLLLKSNIHSQAVS